MKSQLILDSSLDSRIKNILTRYDIFTVDDLIHYDYQKLGKIRGLGEGSLIEIKKYVHEFGNSILNENGPFSSKEDELHSLGRKVLSDYSLDKNVCQFLYQNNIFTLSDLIQTGTLVYQLDGFTKGSQLKLRAFLEELNVTLTYQNNYSKMLLIQLRDNHILEEEKERALENVQIRELYELEYRTRRILDLHDIKTLKDLLMVDKKEIKNYRNMGDVSYQRLAEYFLEFHIFLRDDENNLENDSNKNRQIRLLKLKKELIMKYQLEEIRNWDNRENLKDGKQRVRIK